MTPRQPYSAGDGIDLGLPRNVTVPAAGQPNQIVTAIGFITAISLANASATVAARYLFYDGTDTTGQLILAVAVPAGNCLVQGWGRPGIPFRIGVYVSRLAGALTGALTYVPLIDPV